MPKMLYPQYQAYAKGTIFIDASRSSARHTSVCKKSNAYKHHYHYSMAGGLVEAINADDKGLKAVFVSFYSLINRSGKQITRREHRAYRDIACQESSIHNFILHRVYQHLKAYQVRCPKSKLDFHPAIHNRKPSKSLPSLRCW